MRHTATLVPLMKTSLSGAREIVCYYFNDYYFVLEKILVNSFVKVNNV